MFRSVSWSGNGAERQSRFLADLAGNLDAADLLLSCSLQPVPPSPGSRGPFLQRHLVSVRRSAGRPVIPPKQYKLADVCRVLDIQPYVLRYWQTEFPVLSSKKAAGGRLDYDAEDVETIRRIKELLYDEGYTIASAKKKLASELDEGGVRGRPLIVTEAPADNGEAPAQQAPGDATEAEEAAGEEAEAATAASPADLEVSDIGEIGVLTRRVERLEGGVAALVAQARQLAAELKPEVGVEDD